MTYTIFCKRTGKIVSRQSYQKRSRWYGCIEGDFDDVRFRIDPATGEAYPFIAQDQLPWLIRRECKRRLHEMGATDADLLRWQAAKSMHDMLGEAEIDGSVYSDQAFTDLLLARKAILDRAAALTAMEPIPQDFDNPTWWQ